MLHSLLDNQLLARLPPHVRSDIRAVSETVDLPAGQVLERPGEQIASCYFVDNGLISVVAAAGGSIGEVGMIGREGCTALAFVLGGGSSPNSTVVRSAGSAQRIPVALLRVAMDEAPSLMENLLKFAHVFSVQASQNVLSSGNGTLVQRIARWLLMADDRLDSHEVHLTHDAMSLVLTVRRAGVTEALHVLEGQKLIKASRGVVKVLDREGLVDLASGMYGIPEAEYERVMHPAMVVRSTEPISFAKEKSRREG